MSMRGLSRVALGLCVATGLGGLLPAAAGAAGSGWSLQKIPNHTGSTNTGLNGVACASKSACTVVGSYTKGTTHLTLAERWNGSKWSIQKTPNPTGGINSLKAVACASKSACAAVGFREGGTLAERWNGSKWSVQKTPSLSGATSGFLDGVACTSASACTAVGYYFNGKHTVTLAERWNGSKWSIQKTPNPTGGTSSQLSGVACASKSACTAVGYYYNGTTTLTLSERWNGSKWSLQKTPIPTGATGGSQLNGVACTSASACTAVGYYFTPTATLALAERWKGSKWSLQSTPVPSGATGALLFGVACTSASACTAVGHSYNPTRSPTLAERWNGSKWSVQKTPNPTPYFSESLNGVACPSTSACAAVGQNQKIKGGTSVPLAERWNGG